MYCDDPESAELSRYRDVLPVLPLGAADPGTWRLIYTKTAIQLFAPHDQRGVAIDMAAVTRRARVHDPLPRACGLVRGQPATVLDAMAGWGLDGLSLAAIGARVQMVEKVPALWVLLDAFVVQNATLLPDVRVALGDARDWLSGQRWDVVYLDPMYQPTAKTALPPKRLQMLRLLTSTPADGDSAADADTAADWVTRARRVANDRVVLKRPLRAPAVARPDWQIRGKLVRFDVYRGLAEC